MTREALLEVLDRVGQREGWDFSRMKTDRDPVPWDYVEIVKQYLKLEDRVLDVGTGEGWQVYMNR